MNKCEKDGWAECADVVVVVLAMIGLLAVVLGWL
jgi:hypothetical protein